MPNITGKLKKFDGSGNAGKSLFFKINQQITPFPTGDAGRQEIKTNSSGDFTIALQEGVLYVVNIPAIKIDRVILAPADDVDLFEFWQLEDENLNFYGDES